MTSLPLARRPDTVELLPFDKYDLAIVAFSGGKDSIALIKALRDVGFPREKVRLWHHLIDGGPNDPLPELMMDWPCTPAYCRKVAEALGYRIQFQWRVGGFAGELLKDNAKTRPVWFEREDEQLGTAGGVKAAFGTRMKFPQVSGDLRVRWCSGTLKIDVADLALNNDPFLRNKRILFLSGERREESTNRAKYPEKEAHRVSSSAHLIHHWRAVIDWPEERVWDAMRSLCIVPHPCYRLGFARCSCQFCIFGGADEWATNTRISPRTVLQIARFEERFGLTIKRKESVIELAAKGTPFLESLDPNLVALALHPGYLDRSVLTDHWCLPAGAYRRGGGPT